MYKPNSGYTKQSIIDKINSEFKGKSLRENGVCLYRGTGGTKCAIGLFLPDDSKPIVDKFEGGVYDLIREYPNITDILPLDSETANAGFQRMHDGIIYTGNSVDVQKQALIKWVNNNVEG